MDDLLGATVKAMNEIGMDYRVTYGTLLGSVRSKAIIPYSDDIDLAVHKKDNDNFTRFIALQNHIGSQVSSCLESKTSHKPRLSPFYSVC